MSKQKKALQEIADCEVCLGCQDVAMGALKGQDQGIEPTREDLLKALRDMVESYDDTGCDSCGVVDAEVFERAYILVHLEKLSEEK
jgi:hypothetical protein